MTDYSKLKRDLNEMPLFVKTALAERELSDDFFKRPAYQQNDYLGWIARAKREETARKRLKQMLDELERGGVYMKMDHPASRKK
ncbi:MAG: YdeI/OmpD-associated family protein [Pyrinomonadaceae bacterium]|nr:YdeI/OmpD-associated family protein [Pyrinomonadaceae bacterium]